MSPDLQASEGGDAQAPPNKRKALWTIAKLVLGLGLVGLVVWVLGPDLSELGERATIHPGWLAVGFVGTTLASIVTAARWKLIAETMGGARLPFIAYLYGMVITRLLAYFAPSLAMDLVGRGVALRNAGSDRSLGHSATQIVVERLLDGLLPGFVLVGIVGAQALGTGLDPAVLVGVTLLAFFVASAPLLAPMARIALKLFARIRRKENISTEVELAPKTAWAVAGLSVARFACIVLQFGAVALGIGLSIPWVDMALATPVAQLASIVGITPGALGFQEAGWAGAFSWLGYDGVDSSLYILAQRACVLAYFAVLSALCWPFARRQRRAASVDA